MRTRRLLLLTVVLLPACGNGGQDAAAPESTVEVVKVVCPSGEEPVTSVFDESNALVRTPGEALSIALVGDDKLGDKPFSQSGASADEAEYVYRKEGSVQAKVVVTQNLERLWRVDRITACPALMTR